MAFGTLGLAHLLFLLLRHRASRRPPSQGQVGSTPPTGSKRLVGKEGFEGEAHLEDFHHHELSDSGEDDGHFDLIETTVSHLFREPNDALNGLTYGRLLMRQLRKLGWFTPKPRVIVEVGGGLGYLARELGKELLPFEKHSIRYISLDITQPFLNLQVTRAKAGGWSGIGTRANAEWLPFQEQLRRPHCRQREHGRHDTGEVDQRRASPVEQGRRHNIRKPWIGSGACGCRWVQDLPEDVIFNLGPFRFVAELWRILKPGGRAFLTEFGIEEGWPAPVKLPGHTEYEVQYSHLRRAAALAGLSRAVSLSLQFLAIKPDTKVLCTGEPNHSTILPGDEHTIQHTSLYGEGTTEHPGRHACKTPRLPLPRCGRSCLVRPPRFQSLTSRKTRRGSESQLLGEQRLSMVLAAVTREV